MRILWGVLATILVGLFAAVAVHFMTQQAPSQVQIELQAEGKSPAPANEPQGTEYWPPLYGYSIKVGDTLNAVGAVAGGIIGALGAALAVVLTLRGQRRDETEKICTAITMEIAQLSKFPLEQLATCQAIYEGCLQVPRADLPIFMQTPAPTLYLAAAERISRVHCPALVVAFYIGLVETEKCVNVITKAPSKSPFLVPIEVVGLGVMLVTQCFLARQILSEAPIPTGSENVLVTQMMAEMISRLDKQLSASKAVFPSHEEYEKASAI